MKLNIGQRYGLLDILPREGDFLTLKIIRELQNELSFSEAEIKKFKIIQVPAPDGGVRVTWQDIPGKDKDVSIGEKANDVIVLALSKLNEAKKLKMEHYSLYERFIMEATENTKK